MSAKAPEAMNNYKDRLDSIVYICIILGLYKRNPKQLSLPPTCRLLSDTRIIQFQSETNIGSRRTVPLNKVLQKIQEKKLDNHTRRKSENYAMSTKQQKFQNVPQQIEYLKKVSGAEFAIQSFQQIFKRSKQREAKRLTILLQQQSIEIEHDNMERPPSAASPIKVIRKSMKVIPPNEKFVQYQAQKIMKFTKDIDTRKTQKYHLPLIKDPTAKYHCLTDRTTLHEKVPKRKKKKVNILTQLISKLHLC